jgi:hypothetical protein
MSQQYWVKNAADGEAYGPYSAAELRGFAVEGRVGQQSLISVDGAKWHPAARVRGLLEPSAPPGPAPDVASVATAEAEQYSDAAVATQPIGLAYHTPGGSYDTAGAYALPPLRPRSAVPFCIVAVLMFIAGGIIAVEAYGGRMSSSPRSMDDMAVSLISFAAFFLLSIPALILWLMWVGAAHRDMALLSERNYSISPGQAIGLSFVPVFDAFWVIYMPWRLANELNRHLLARRLRPISAGAVMGCQIGSVVAALFFPGVTPGLYAVSLSQVQAGLNRLATASGA